MNPIRTAIVILLGLLMLALVVCAKVTRRSERAMALEVRSFIAALMPPMLGNLIIMASSSKPLALVGCYCYYIGIDFTVFALLRFACSYCDMSFAGTRQRRFAEALVALDVVQLLLNPLTGHAFALKQLVVDGAPYYALVPLWGQHLHRMASYLLFLASVLVFARKVSRSPRIYVERYLVILASMVVTGAWETYYVISGTPIDRSMVGYGIFGLLIFYFSLYFKPYRLRNRILADMVSELDDAVLFFDADRNCFFANRTAERLLGISGEAALEQAQLRVEGLLGASISLEEDWDSQRSVIRDGEQLFLESSLRSIRDKDGTRTASYLRVHDRTGEELKLRREVYLAGHDRLTGLYNQDRLFASTRSLLDAYPHTDFVVVAMDVKEFKLVNDIFSKEYGDKVLVAIAEILRASAVSQSIYGRISGDRFGLVAPTDAFDADSLVSKLQAISVSNDVRHPITAHVGIYEVTERDLAPSVMFDRAFMAISSIKNEYQRHVAVYDDAMREGVVWSQTISSQLSQAIEQNQIRPYLQPLVNAQGEIEGAEALVRWIHPEYGFLPPVRFVPIFEENGCIAQLDVHMWESACRILKEWQREGIDHFISVNISPKDFYFIDVLETITGLVERYGIDPHKLRLEITETVMMSDQERRLRIIDELRTRGFIVEMDDFGSGYSSLNMLKDMPVDVLKIDMMFLYKTENQGRAQTILQGIIDLSQRLGISSITEGVETIEQRDMLVDMGCSLFQGYYFAKPMPFDEFERFCEERERTEAHEA